MPVDTRRVVGGFVWARADAVSHDCKRIYGAGLRDKWLRGTVLSVHTKKPDGAKRGTTFVIARFTVGDKEYEPELTLQTLKAEDPATLAVRPPSPPHEHAPPPAAVPMDNNQLENVQPTIEPLGSEQSDETNAPPVNAGYEVDSSDSEDSAAGLQQQGNRPVATSHGRNWYNRPTDVDMNGATPHRIWKMTCQYTGYAFTPGCDDTSEKYDETLNAFTPYDFFMACFPKDQLRFMVDAINVKLRKDNTLPSSQGELLKWFGITIMMTQFEFGDRSSLWSTSCSRWNKYIPPASFGEKTGMSRQRYDDLHRAMVWSSQPDVRPEYMSSETYRWM